MNLRLTLLWACLVLCSGCTAQEQQGYDIELTPAGEGATTVNSNQVHPLIDETGTPISTRIVEDESLGTVHTFDLFPVVLAKATFSETDRLWRIPVWVSGGSSLAEPGYPVSVVLGYSDTVIEYNLLPGRIFEWKAGGRAQIEYIVGELAPGEQIFLHVIGEHGFSADDMAAIAEVGFDYPQLVYNHEAENMAILQALLAGSQPPPGELRGAGAIFRGTD